MRGMTGSLSMRQEKLHPDQNDLFQLQQIWLRLIFMLTYFSEYDRIKRQVIIIPYGTEEQYEFGC